MCTTGIPLSPLPMPAAPQPAERCCAWKTRCCWSVTGPFSARTGPSRGCPWPLSRGERGVGAEPPFPSTLRSRGSELGRHGPSSRSHCEEWVPRQGALGGHHPPCPARHPHPFPCGDKGWGGSSCPPRAQSLTRDCAATQKLPHETEPSTHPALSRLAGPESIPAALPCCPVGSMPWGKRQPWAPESDPGYRIHPSPPSQDTATPKPQTGHGASLCLSPL